MAWKVRRRVQGPITRSAGGTTSTIAGDAVGYSGTSLVIGGGEIFYFSDRRVSGVWRLEIWRSAR